jgi:hypothetical protein
VFAIGLGVGVLMFVDVLAAMALGGTGDLIYYDIVIDMYYPDRAGMAVW